MRKYTIILLFVSILLVGCNTKKTQILSFAQTVNVFSDSIKNIQTAIDALWFTWHKSIDLFLETDWENGDFKLRSNLNTQAIVDYQDSKLQSNTSFDAYFWDKWEQKESSISWNISNTLIKNDLYFMTNDIVLDAWTWNYQGDLLHLIVQNIKDKRIKITTQQDKIISKTYYDIQFVLNTFSSQDAFQLTEQISYDGKVAYKATIKPEILQQINSDTNLQINRFQWMFIIHSTSKIELKLEDVEISTDQKLLIKGSILPKSWKLRIQQPDVLEKIIEISRESNKRYMSLSIASLLNLKEMIWLDARLYPKKTPHETETQINWMLNISPLIIYGSDLEKNIQIDINGQYIFNDIKQPNITKPDSYVLWEQIIWDEFSLETIMTKQ